MPLDPLAAETARTDLKALQKRARRKFASHHLAVALVRAEEQAQVFPDQPAQLGRYWQTYHCASSAVERPDGKVISSYCRKRWCPVCSNIRNAQLLRRYGPVVDAWAEAGEGFLVTLTAPTIGPEALAGEVRARVALFSRIAGRMKKQAHRGQRAEFAALRALDNSYNPREDKYHPHFHALVRGRENARDLVRYWLEARPDASPAAQDIRPARPGAAVEVVKYAAKIVDAEKGRKGEGRARAVYADALNFIFHALEGVRTVQTYGPREAWPPAPQLEAEAAPSNEEKQSNRQLQVLLRSSEGEQKRAAERLGLNIFRWSAGPADWFSFLTGEALSGYEPAEAYRQLWERAVVVRAGYGTFSWLLDREKARAWAALSVDKARLEAPGGGLQDAKQLSQARARIRQREALISLLWACFPNDKKGAAPAGRQASLKLE